MDLMLWSLLLLGAVAAAHWGADQLSLPLQKLRRQWGFSEAAGAALVALATASPEIGTNAVSAAKGLSDIGLGNLLGSNIISVPAIVTVAYLASQTASANEHQEPLADTATDSKQNPSHLRRVDSWTALRVKPEALTLQAIPYLGIVALAAVLTIPPPWRGLQPIDGWIMLAAYGLYVAQAFLREREATKAVRWNRSQIYRGLGGALALALGAYCVVTATENIVSILGIPQLIGGLFITSTLSIAPEVFTTWSVARSGQMTSATTSVIADNAATMTLAFFPLAIVGIEVKDSLLFIVNFAFMALLGVVYAAMILWGREKNSFELWEVGLLLGIYGVYVVVLIFGVL